MSRAQNKAMHCLLNAGYEVRVHFVPVEEEPYHVGAWHKLLPTRYAKGVKLGRAMTNLLKATGLDESG